MITMLQYAILAFAIYFTCMLVYRTVVEACILRVKTSVTLPTVMSIVMWLLFHYIQTHK